MLTLLGALFALALVGLGAWTLLDLSARHTFDAHRAFQGVQSLTVNDDGGDVRLTGAPAGSKLTVTEHVTEGLSVPHRHVQRTAGGKLALRASCEAVFSSECGVDYVISVPSGVAVRVNSGAGDVSAVGLSSRASIYLESGAGDVRSERTNAANVTLSTGAGDVSAQFLRPPALLIAESGAGDLSLTVPNVSYALQASSGAGSVSDSHVKVDPSSRRVIRATSGAGDVRIGVGP
jgi:hypothetical protein